jgi:formylglycine-generating enzyme required for sulfatase activity
MEKKILREALLDAFDRQKLKMMLSDELNEKLDKIVGGENNEDIVFNLIEWAEENGRLPELIQGAFNSNPGNPKLQKFVENNLNFVLELDKDEFPIPYLQVKSFISILKTIKEPQLIKKCLESSLSKRFIANAKNELKKLEDKTKLSNYLIPLKIILKEHPRIDDNLVIIKFANALKEKIQSDYSRNQLESWLTNNQQYKTPKLTVTVLLNQFSFKTVTVNKTGKIIKQEEHQAQYFTENLPGGVPLDMVLIPGGTFMMGAPEGEVGSDYSERPQHEENVKQFFMGKYPITQRQWRAVASLPKIDRDLKPNHSYFRKDLSPEEKNNLPVKCVSWYDAVEFCARLSKASEKEYKLPREAEWEYACRAKTTSPFYYGETITSELVNFVGTKTYADSPKGEYREKTTKVGIFPPNAFGLYDMHGNVWEWCSDSYSSETKEGNDNRSEKIKEENRTRLLRGGSWNDFPEDCRCAYRYYNNPDFVIDYIGFRVMCVEFRED